MPYNKQRNERDGFHATVVEDGLSNASHHLNCRLPTVWPSQLNGGNGSFVDEVLQEAVIRAFGVNSIVDYLFRWLGLQCSEEFRVEQVVKSASADEPEMPPQGNR